MACLQERKLSLFCAYASGGLMVCSYVQVVLPAVSRVARLLARVIVICES